MLTPSATFASLPNVHKIVLVLTEDRLTEGVALADRYGGAKVMRVSKGGARRQDSVRAGLDGLGPCDWVMVHDGARPLVDGPTIVRGLEAARDTGAAVCAVPAKDTIKVVSNDGLVRETPPREHLWQVANATGVPILVNYGGPWQVRRDLYRRRRHGGKAGNLGKGVHGFISEYQGHHPGGPAIGKGPNEVPKDRRRLSMNIRVGLGFDVHPLMEGRTPCLGRG